MMRRLRRYSSRGVAACPSGVRWTASLAICLAAAACNPDGSPNWGGSSGGSGGGKSGGGWSLGQATGATETWTIECNAYEGESHRETADRLATALKRVRNLEPSAVRVEHGDDRSFIYYGEYPLKYKEAKVDKPRGGGAAKGEQVVELSAQIKQDMTFIRGLAVGDQYPFFSARAMPRPISNVGPPEWNLENAKGVYTLQVGVTYNTATLHDYKQAAIDWVRVLRDDGYEAYYYHDPDKAISNICVGTFGDDAYIADSPSSHRYSEAVLRLQGKADFQWNLENGCKVYRGDPATGSERLANQSFLVLIPNEDNRSRGKITRSAPR